MCDHVVRRVGGIGATLVLEVPTDEHAALRMADGVDLARSCCLSYALHELCKLLSRVFDGAGPVEPGNHRQRTALRDAAAAVILCEDAESGALEGR